MTKRERVIGALRVLEKDAPDLYESIIEDTCPHDSGLKGLCKTEDEKDEAVTERCLECWRLALEGEG